jgi:hypothetical protein
MNPYDLKAHCHIIILKEVKRIININIMLIIIFLLLLLLLYPHVILNNKKKMKIS